MLLLKILVNTQRIKRYNNNNSDVNYDNASQVILKVSYASDRAMKNLVGYQRL